MDGLDAAPKVGVLRHVRACSAKSSGGFKQRRCPGKIEKSEEHFFSNVGKAAAGAGLAGEQASVLAMFANNEEAQCAVDGELEVAAELPSDIAFEKSAYDNGVECADDGQLVVEEPELALLGLADALSAEGMFAETHPHAFLGLQHMIAGPAASADGAQRLCTKFNSQSGATKRSAGSELGGAAKKPCGSSHRVSFG